jgi:hypothetical protein
MKRASKPLLVFAAAALALAMPSSLRAGGDADEHDEDPDAGPIYYGFVKDHRGVLVGDAKVTAELKGKGSVIARTDILGVYKIPGFGKDTNPDDVTISCAKDGFKQARVLRKPVEPGRAVETECYLQRQ